MDKITIKQIAEVCHEANRVLQNNFIGTFAPLCPHWAECNDEIKASVIDGVKAVLSGDITRPGESHANWVRFKLDHGWTWGPTKDEAAKTHPLLVPFDRLSQADQAKDVLFVAIVTALAPLPHD
jgi:hypothetical protein